MKYVTIVDDKTFSIEVVQADHLLVNGEPYQIDLQLLGEGGMLSLLLNNRSIEAAIEEKEGWWEVLLEGELYTVRVQDERLVLLNQAQGKSSSVHGEVTIKAPMPGIIVRVPMPVGSAVNKGATVVILESMKMENELKAPRAGVVKRVLVEGGMSVEKGQPLVIVGDPEGEEAA